MLMSLSKQIRRLRTQDADDFGITCGDTASQREKPITCGASDSGLLFEVPSPPEASAFYRGLGAHGVLATVNLGRGWSHQCVCGFQTPESESLELAGKSFDEHLK